MVISTWRCGLGDRALVHALHLYHLVVKRAHHVGHHAAMLGHELVARLRAAAGALYERGVDQRGEVLLILFEQRGLLLEGAGLLVEQTLRNRAVCVCRAELSAHFV